MIVMLATMEGFRFIQQNTCGVLTCLPGVVTQPKWAGPSFISHNPSVASLSPFVTPHLVKDNRGEQVTALTTMELNC